MMGNEPEKLNFNVGDEVYLIPHSFSSTTLEHAKLTTVEKVHKTTRFTLDGNRRQFGQDGYQSGDAWVLAVVKHATPEFKLKVETAKKFSNMKGKARLALNEAAIALNKMKTVEEIDAYMSRIWEIE